MKSHWHLVIYYVIFWISLPIIMLQRWCFELRPGGIDDEASKGRVIIQINIDVNESPGVWMLNIISFLYRLLVPPGSVTSLSLNSVILGLVIVLGRYLALRVQRPLKSAREQRGVASSSPPCWGSTQGYCRELFPTRLLTPLLSATIFFGDKGRWGAVKCSRS